jgi:hypothetical protein
MNLFFLETGFRYVIQGGFSLLSAGITATIPG